MPPTLGRVAVRVEHKKKQVKPRDFGTKKKSNSPTSEIILNPEDDTYLIKKFFSYSSWYKWTCDVLSNTDTDLRRWEVVSNVHGNIILKKFSASKELVKLMKDFSVGKYPHTSAAIFYKEKEEDEKTLVAEWIPGNVKWTIPICMKAVGYITDSLKKK